MYNYEYIPEIVPIDLIHHNLCSFYTKIRLLTTSFFVGMVAGAACIAAGGLIALIACVGGGKISAGCLT